MKIIDTECYKDYFLVMTLDTATGAVDYDEVYPGKPRSWVFPKKDHTYISFNGQNYDIPMLSLYMAGADNATMKRANDDIIVNELRPRQIERRYGGTDLSRLDHIDLMNVAPTMCGLKTYGGRMHFRKLQDLPIEPSESISPEDRVLIRHYCRNDLQVTFELFKQLEPQIELRKTMGDEFRIDLRSKSDAQIAEAVIKSEVEKRLGCSISRPEIHPSYSFKFRVPEFVHFSTPGMQTLLKVVTEAVFTIGKDGSVDLPAILTSMRVCIGDGVYKMGIGGLHSTEKNVSYQCQLIDRDVTSYYPSVILTQGLYPSHMTKVFLDVYKELVDRRIAAKRTGNKVMADALKICVNGSFGKFGSKWSVLYSPDLLIQVTLTGQLALLMLIEQLTLAGYTVVSANTDGIVVVAHDKNDKFNALIASWEIATRFATEETIYSALWSKDVNNYVAIKADGTTKLKGLYAPSGLSKNTTNEICVDAVLEYILCGTPIDYTILSCTDIRKFVTLRQVKGGAVYDGKFLGKTVRWYYRSGETRCIEYKENGNMVSRSKGTFPLMDLPDQCPVDLDYQWYISEAKNILTAIGG